MLSGMVHSGSCKSLTKQESLEVGCQLRQSGETLQTGRQQVPDRQSDDKIERVLTKRFQIIFRNFKDSCLKIGLEGCVMLTYVQSKDER